MRTYYFKPKKNTSFSGTLEPVLIEGQEMYIYRMDRNGKFQWHRSPARSIPAEFLDAYYTLVETEAEAIAP